MLVADPNDIDLAATLAEINATTISATITPREVVGADAATGKFLT